MPKAPLKAPEAKAEDKGPAAAPPAGKPGRSFAVAIDSPDKDAKDALLHSSGAKSEFGVFAGVDLKQLEFKQPPESDLRIVECRSYAAAAFRCDILDGGQGIKIVPTSEAVLKSVRLELTFESRQIALTVQSKGPATIRVEQVRSAGRVNAVELGADKIWSPWSITWKKNDKIRISVLDPDFQRISGIKVDDTPVKIADDPHIDVPVSAEMKAISIETEARLFSGSVNVISPDGPVRIRLGSDVLETLPAGGTKEVKVKNVRLGMKLTVEPMDPEKFKVKALNVSGGSDPRSIPGTIVEFQRKDIGSQGKIALHLDVRLQSTGVTLPAVAYLKPVVLIGKRKLDLNGCKATLEGLPFKPQFLHQTNGRTKVDFGTGKLVPETGRYTVNLDHPDNTDTIFCSSLKGVPIPASDLRVLGQGAELTVIADRPGSRAFVGIVHLEGPPQREESSWRAALAALKVAFEAGAKSADGGKRRYLWGAIYRPDGEKIAFTEAADETLLQFDVNKGDLMERLTAGTSSRPLSSLLRTTLKEVEDFGDNIDLLVVATVPGDKCGWSSPWEEVLGSRAALVRIVGRSAQKDRGLYDGVRLCATEKAGVAAEVEVAYREFTRTTSTEEQLRLAIREAAKGLLK